MVTANMTREGHESTGQGTAVQVAPADRLDTEPGGHRVGIAIGVIGLLLLALTAVDWNRTASGVVLPVSDTDDLAVTVWDLPSFPVQTSSSEVRQDRTWAYVSTSFTSDEGAPGAELYPHLISQRIHYTNDASDAREALEHDRSWNKRIVDRMLGGSPQRYDLSIRPGGRESRVTRAIGGNNTVAYEIDYLLNNIAIDVVLAGNQDALSEERALELARISLKKFDAKVRSRTRFVEFPVDDLRFETIVHPVVTVAIPLIGYVLFLLFVRSAERGSPVQIKPDAFSIGLAALYALLLWKAISISGSGDRILFEVEGWLGKLTICLTIILAAMGLRLLWQQRLPPIPRQRTAGRPFSGQASCPRCRRLSPASSARCEHCGLEFRQRA